VAGADPVACVPVEATDPLYILYTSGTTGQPKGIVRDNGGHAVALAWSMRNVYGAAAGERYWAASDIGWVVGHSYIVYGPLLAGCTTVLYEGKPVGTPDAGAYWRMVSEYGISTLFTAPTAFRAIRQHDPDAHLMRDYDLSPLRALFLAGERCDPATLLWASDKLGIPVVDHWWQTETGWPMVANPLGIEQLPVKPGSATRPVPGWDIRIVDEAGSEKPAGEIGDIVVKLPMPPGALPTLWNAHERFAKTYLSEHPGYYQTFDAGYIDEDGYVFVMGRTDDVINVAGHRLSTGALEEIVASHPAVAECAVIGVPDELKGELPLGLVVLKTGVEIPHDDVSREIVALVRENLGPVAAFHTALVVDRLPKTRSGKILRRTLRQLASGEEPSVPATIEDPAVLDEVAAVFEGIEAEAQPESARRSSKT
jgi:propionyl-CoA synthetase